MPPCYRSGVAKVSAGTAWDTPKNLHDLSRASGVTGPGMAIEAGAGTEIGAKRILSGALDETRDSRQKIHVTSLKFLTGQVQSR